MAFIRVEYDSLTSLKKHFQNMNVFRYAVSPLQTNPPPNFVLVDPKLYYGSYGGLLSNRFVQDKECIFDPIDKDFSLVWWNASLPRHVGDTHVLSVGVRVAVTPTMFKQMQINPIRRSCGKSSYYGNKALIMN